MISDDVFWNTDPGSAGFHRVTMPARVSPLAVKKSENLRIAALGESLIAKNTEQAGWTPIVQRLRGKGFELDLVIRRGGFVRIIEVKTRLNPRLPPGGDVTSTWLSPGKRLSMWRGAEKLLATGLVSPADHISFELVGVDVMTVGQTLVLYRWPNVM